MLPVQQDMAISCKCGVDVIEVVQRLWPHLERVLQCVQSVHHGGQVAKAVGYMLCPVNLEAFPPARVSHL